MVGVVFDPSGTRMYFSSQRAYPHVPGTPVADGATYEVTGPFRLPDESALERSAFGPPAGERDDGLDYLIGDVDGLAVDAPGGLSGSRMRVGIELDRPGAVHLALRTFDLEREASGDATHDRPRPVTLARSSQTLSAGGHVLELALPLGARRLLGTRVNAVLTVLAVDSAGGRRVAARRVAL
jgi:hypothetical protein